MLDIFFLFNEDLALWKVIIEIDLQYLHQVLELRRFFPITAPYDDHHRLFEDTEQMNSIDNPCCCFTQMDEMPGPILVVDAYNKMFCAWKDLLESIIIQLRDTTADHAKLLKGLLWIWTSCELRFKLVFERKVPVDVAWRLHIALLGLLTICHLNILSDCSRDISNKLSRPI